MAQQDVWMGIKEAANYCGKSIDTLSRRRKTKRPPVYYIRTGTVAYKRSDLDSWMAGIQMPPITET